MNISFRAKILIKFCQWINKKIINSFILIGAEEDHNTANAQKWQVMGESHSGVVKPWEEWENNIKNNHRWFFYCDLDSKLYFEDKALFS